MKYARNRLSVAKVRGAIVRNLYEAVMSRQMDPTTCESKVVVQVYCEDILSLECIGVNRYLL